MLKLILHYFPIRLFTLLPLDVLPCTCHPRTEVRHVRSHACRTRKIFHASGRNVVSHTFYTLAVATRYSWWGWTRPKSVSCIHAICCNNHQIGFAQKKDDITLCCSLHVCPPTHSAQQPLPTPFSCVQDRQPCLCQLPCGIRRANGLMIQFFTACAAGPCDLLSA